MNESIFTTGENMNQLKQLLVNNKQLLDRIKMCNSEEEFVAELLHLVKENSVSADFNDLQTEMLSYKSINTSNLNLTDLMAKRNNNCFNEG